MLVWLDFVQSKVGKCTEEIGVKRLGGIGTWGRIANFLGSIEVNQQLWYITVGENDACTLFSDSRVAVS